MDEAKFYYRLSNGVMVNVGDKIELITEDDEKYIGVIIDIGHTFVLCELTDGYELDLYFSDIKDIQLVN